MIILRLLLLLTNLHLKLLSTQGTGADKLLSTQRVNNILLRFFLVQLWSSSVVHIFAWSQLVMSKKLGENYNVRHLYMLFL